MSSLGHEAINVADDDRNQDRYSDVCPDSEGGVMEEASETVDEHLDENR